MQIETTKIQILTCTGGLPCSFFIIFVVIVLFIYLFFFFTTWFLSIKFYSTNWILMVFIHDITLLWMILKLGNEKVLRVLFLYLSCFARVRIFDVNWVTLNLITPITYRVHLTHIFLRFSLLNSLRSFGKCKYGRRLFYACLLVRKRTVSVHILLVSCFTIIFEFYVDCIFAQYCHLTRVFRM